MAKILINLHSKQTIPNYVAIKEFKPDRAIALTTKEYEDQVKVFEEITKIEHILKPIDAYNLENNFNIIQEVVDELGAENEIIVNYTGGTKVMSLKLCQGMTFKI